MPPCPREPDFDLPIPESYRGHRLDRALAALLPDYSRSRLQRWLADGALTVDDASPAARTSVAGGERVRLMVPAEDAVSEAAPEPIRLDIVYEDAAILVIDKAAGRVMHPGAGNADGTLQNALLYHEPALAALPRAGIVHRLDKDTSGILVVAKTFAAHKRLVADLAARTIKREYEAVALGVLTAGGHVDAAIDRHPVDRKRMAVREDGRTAITHYRVIQRYRAHTHIRCELETGRTHQIRVHMAHIRHPLLGDPVYGRRLAVPRESGAALIAALRGFRRQALHAKRLGLTHPITGAAMEWEAPRPADFDALLTALDTDARAHQSR